jgi:hypothetical protein
VTLLIEAFRNNEPLIERLHAHRSRG